MFSFQPGDFFRGLFQAAKEATEQGAKMRGKTKDVNGNFIDWTFGATNTTTKYVVDNKTRLAGAGAGGGGFILGKERNRNICFEDY